MMQSLPGPIARYFAAKNAQDFDLAIAQFAAAAVVEDERHSYRDADAIRAWMRETSAKYADKARVLSTTERGKEMEIVAEVAGTFPGSPARIRFLFELQAGRIVRLRIGS